MDRQRIEHLEVEDRRPPAPGGNRSLPDAFLPVGDDQVGIEVDRRPQPVALRARPVGAVEGEKPRRDFRVAHVAVGAGELLAVEGAVSLPVDDAHQPVGEGEGERHGIGQSSPRPLRDPHPVDHHIDVVLPLPVEDDLFVQASGLAVHEDPGEPFPGELDKLSPVFALTAPDDRGQNLHLLPGAQSHHGIDDLGYGLLADFPTAGRAMDDPDRCVKKPQVVVDLGDGPHRRPRVLADRLLLDGDGGGEPLDRVDVGFFHLLEELSCVGGQGLDIPSLSLRVDRVEGERRLPRPRDPGDHDQTIPGDLHVDILQVVLPRPAHEDPVERHGVYLLAAAMPAAMRRAARRLLGLAVPLPAMS